VFQFRIKAQELVAMSRIVGLAGGQHVGHPLACTS
jgi:hypothetical protein